MADDPKKASPKGLKVGDFYVRPTLSVRTNARLDSEANRERARRAEEDQRAAQFGGGIGEDEGPSEATEQAALAAVDQAIEKGRAEAAAGEEIPILLRDPVTGRVIRHE